MDEEIPYTDEKIPYPNHFSDIISLVLNFLANYGWYLLISLSIFLYVYDKYLRSIIETHKLHKEEADYSAKYHKNPDLLSARLNAQEKRTLELQEKYKRDAEKYKEKLEEKEEKKKNEKNKEIIEKYNDGGHTLGSSSSKSFKPDYNPLMGSGSSSNYKPQKKSACGKGGCG